MAKIKILTDSACDITDEQEQSLGIHIIPFKVTVGDVGYTSRVDFDNSRFYEIMDAYEGIPATSQVMSFEYVEVFRALAEEGYTDIINIIISSTGSNTYNNAVFAKDQFFQEYPQYAGKIEIHNIDSRNYTGVYGYAVIQAAQKALKGASVGEILAFVQDWIDNAYVIFAPFNLKYAKKSGRISVAAAFVGEVLGLKPIIKIADGVSSILEKVRGDKAVIPKIIDIASKEMIPQTPYSIMWGSDAALRDEIAQAMTKKVGYPPADFFQVGAAVACNAGHKVAGLVIKGRNR
ncbi:MAG: DegV family protein [Oscillospiraceae bacterium]